MGFGGHHRIASGIVGETGDMDAVAFSRDGHGGHAIGTGQKRFEAVFSAL